MKNKENKRANAAMFLGGLAIGMCLFMMLGIEITDDIKLFVFAASLFAASAVFFMIIFMLESFLIPYINRRKAAVRALGRDGIRILRHDETAKLAYKGIYAIMAGKFPQAEDHLQKALAHSDVRQNQMFCVEWLIRLYETMENDTKLLWCYRKAVEFSPDNPDAQSRLGHAYFSEGKLDRAVYCFEQALRYDPNNGYAYFSLAKIQLVRGEDENAFETLQKLLKINENHPLCHAELADYYAMQGNREMAEEECKKAQLCGIKDPDELNKRINAMLDFHETEFSGNDLPQMFYRRIEKPEQDDRANEAN